MEKAQAISAAKLEAKVGQTLQVIVDDIDEDGMPPAGHGPMHQRSTGTCLLTRGLRG